jgi:transcriptional regulator GlxA family with amidase domain
VAGKLVGDPRIDGRPGLERAIGYIREHIAEPVAMRDLVAASGISARSLQLAFRKAYGMGPISFVRNLRLQYVRDELRAATAAGTLVADVAGRWGFFNVSHFTQVYKRRFHSLPSADLRGRRVAGVRRGCCADAIANAENQ